MNNKLDFTENFEMVSTEELQEVYGGSVASDIGFVLGFALGLAFDLG